MDFSILQEYESDGYSYVDNLITNDETLELIEEINTKVEALELLNHIKYISKTPEELLRNLKVIDNENVLEGNNISLETIELKVELELRDMPNLWRMLGAVNNRLMETFRVKGEGFETVRNEYLEKVFRSRELIQSKFTSNVIKNIMDSNLYMQIPQALQSITRHIPRNIYIVQTESDYSRIIRACNFDAGMQKLSLRMGRFFAVGKNKARVRQFYEKTEFAFVYRKDIPMNMAGYQASLKGLEDLYNNAATACINVCRHLTNAFDSYTKELRPIGTRLSNLPDRPESHALASLQIKLINDYLRLANVVDTRLDTTFSRVNSLPIAARQVTKELKKGNTSASAPKRNTWF